jgi:glycosyltransferase involved in cell wall biosynthesis
MKNTTNNKTDINDISILTSSHSTFDTRIFHKEACSLANAGYDVTLITPHYESTVRNGVKIKAVGSEDSESADFGHAREIYTEAKNTETDVYHFHDPGLIPFAILLSYELDAKVIYDCHEDYKRAFRHYNYPPDYLNPITTRLYPTLQSLSARRFDGVVAATDWIARDFNKRGHENVTLVRNFPKKSILKSDNISIKAEHKHTLVYVGGLSEQRGLFRMLRLTRDLRDQGMDIGLWLIGYLNSNDENKAKKYINKNGLESNIRLFGYVDPDKLFGRVAKRSRLCRWYSQLRGHS